MDIQQKPENIVKQLSELCDVLGLREEVVKHTKYGKQPHPSDQWGFTRAFIAEYADRTDAQEVIAIFEGLGIKDEIGAARWLLKHDDLIA